MAQIVLVASADFKVARARWNHHCAKSPGLSSACNTSTQPSNVHGAYRAGAHSGTSSICHGMRSYKAWFFLDAAKPAASRAACTALRCANAHTGGGCPARETARTAHTTRNKLMALWSGKCRVSFCNLAPVRSALFCRGAVAHAERVWAPQGTVSLHVQRQPLSRQCKLELQTVSNVILCQAWTKDVRARR